MRLLRRTRRQPSRYAKPPVLLGVIGALALLAGTYFAFAKRIPFVEGYRVEAVFQSSNGLRSGSPVRIAGVEVGKVVGFDKGPDATRIVRMEIGDRGRPVHRDATLRIRPRLFLEGGYYIDLHPGSPSAPELEDGATVGLPQTAIPVQFDQILSTLHKPIRASLRSAIEELDRSLDDGGAQAAAAAARPLATTFRDGSIVLDAARGTEERDVSRLVSGAAKATRALAGRRGELASLVTGLSRTTAALAAESGGLRASLRELDGVMASTPGALSSIVGTLPAADRLLADARPGLRRARTVLPGVERLLAQLEAASAPAELPGLLDDLRPATDELPVLAARLTTLFPLVTPVTDCVHDNALPVLEAEVDDGHLSTGRPVWKNLADAATGLASAGAPFDANGGIIRYLFTAGENTVSTGAVPGLGTLTGPASGAILGARPRWMGPGRRPAFRPDAPCTEQALPNLKARTSGGAPMRRSSAKVRRRSANAAELRRMLRPANLRKLLKRAGRPGVGGR